jgi:hypothetical protein
MVEVNFRGQISSITLKGGTAKLTIETDLEKTKLDELKVLLDKDLDFSLLDNQSTLDTGE